MCTAGKQGVIRGTKWFQNKTGLYPFVKYKQ